MPKSTEALETRLLPSEDCQLRTSKDGKITGYAAVFNRRSLDLGGFREEIIPGAFKEVLAGSPDTICGIDHEGGLSLLGRTVSGTLQIEEDAAGLLVNCTPPDTSAGRDARCLIERGDIRGMSFAFRVAPNGDSWREEPDGTMVRTISKVSKLADVTVATRPAYPDTSVACRSLDDHKAAREAATKNEKPSGPSPDALRRRAEIARRMG